MGQLQNRASVASPTGVRRPAEKSAVPTLRGGRPSSAGSTGDPSGSVWIGKSARGSRTPLCCCGMPSGMRSETNETAAVMVIVAAMSKALGIVQAPQHASCRALSPECNGTDDFGDGQRLARAHPVGAVGILRALGRDRGESERTRRSIEYEKTGRQTNRRPCSRLQQDRIKRQPFVGPSNRTKSRSLLRRTALQKSAPTGRAALRRFVVHLLRVPRSPMYR